MDPKLNVLCMGHLPNSTANLQLAPADTLNGRMENPECFIVAASVWQPVSRSEQYRTYIDSQTACVLLLLLLIWLAPPPLLPGSQQVCKSGQVNVIALLLLL